MFRQSIMANGLLIGALWSTVLNEGEGFKSEDGAQMMSGGVLEMMGEGQHIPMGKSMKGLGKSAKGGQKVAA